LPVAPIQCFHDKQFPSKAMFLHFRCSGNMRGRQAISCCSRSRFVYPLHRSPNHLRLQLQLSLSARVQYIRVRGYLAFGGYRTTGMCERYEGVAAWLLLGQIVEIVESTNARRLRQRQPKNICIKSIQDRGAPPLREL
jgi:hypothetical protein